MTNLADIATTIRKHSPGVLPESLVLWNSSLHVRNPVVEGDGSVRFSHSPLPDDIAEAVLRDAMVHDPSVPDIVRNNVATSVNGVGYTTYGPVKDAIDPGTHEAEEFLDSDHGGCTGACYQAWRWAKGLPAV